MLLDLKRDWISKWYFVEKRLNELPEAEKDNFGHLYCTVIDYLSLYKNYFQSKYAFKTADALIIKSDTKLQFIEFKWLNNNSDIEEYIKTRYFSLKVKDSFSLLNLLINDKTFSTIEKRTKFNETKNEFIFSIACDNLDPRISILLDIEIAWLEDYDKTLKKVRWINTKDIEKYL